VVGGRDTRGMSPGEIDAYVRAQLAAGADLYTLHADALAELRPDLIVTQDLCRVCALPSGHVAEALDYLGCQSDVLSLDPYTLDEVLDTIRAVHAGGTLLHPTVVDELVREVSRDGEAPAATSPLTAREREVLTLIARGRANKAIAFDLGVAEKTVKTHVSNILGKLGLSDRTQAALYAVREGLAD